jgi:hypothetical protein
MRDTNVLAGLSGHLVSEALLEAQLAQPRRAAEAATARPDFARWRRRCRLLGPASALRAVFEEGAEPFCRHLGFGPLHDVCWLDHLAVATVANGSRAIVLIVSRWGERLDSFWRTAVTESGRRSADWCLLFNGSQVRLIESARVYSRRYLEFDLDVSIDDIRSFEGLWSVMHASGFREHPGESPPIERLVRQSERHAASVCRSLRDGVLEASTSVLTALIAGLPAPPIERSFEQALTIVYRIVFLLFAEGRELVPVWHPVYRDSYSMEALREIASAYESAPGMWDALRAASRLAHAGCRAGSLSVTPFNGRLFAPAGTPLIERRNLDDRAAGHAVLAVATRPSADRTGRERIAYRDLGVDQLGAVYETLLDYQPRVRPATSRGGRPASPAVELEPGSGLRKATGTFYTPLPLAQYLVRRTLAPLVRDRSPERILQLKVLDPAMGSGAFLVAACEYLARAYEAALVSAGGHHPSDLPPSERCAIRRTIAERCLFGVDLNPMAVQLARLSLWLATLAGDRPLSFLDHHLQTGNSLLGTSLERLRRPPGSKRSHRVEELPLLERAHVAETLRASLPVRFALAETPNDTLEQVRDKERALARMTHRDSALARWKRVADLWCAHWFGPSAAPASAFHALSDHLLGGRGPLSESTSRRYLTMAEATARERRFFHWELEFPEVFFDSNGSPLAAPGFDAVIGNPPWKMIRANRATGHTPQPDAAAVTRFSRGSGLYEAQSDGHANLYQLFVERAIKLACSDGRIGLVLPAGLATDHGSGPLRRFVLSRASVDALVGFDNRRHIFPIHRSLRFLLLTATTGKATEELLCRLGESDPTVLDGQDDVGRNGFPVRLTPALIERLSGPSLQIPDLRSPLDLAIAERAASLFPPLGHLEGWSARFGRELNATDDRSHLRRTGRGVPVLEGKQLEPFRADVGAARWRIGARDLRHLLGNRCDHQRLAYRDVASPTNRVTLIAALLPAGCATTHTVFCLRTALPVKHQHFLCGLFNSFVVNYLVRLRVSTHVTTAIVEHLPIPTVGQSGHAFDEISRLARRLSGDRRLDAAARLNAQVAWLYQLTREEFQRILETFPLVPQEEREAAASAFSRL